MTQFIDLPKLGKNEWWRYLLSLALIVTFPLAVAIIAVEVSYFVGPPLGRTDGLNTGKDPITSFVELSGFDAALIIGILLAVRIFHKRPFLTVITPNLSVDWKKIGKSLGLFFGLVALATVVDYLLNPSTYQFSLNPERFLIFAPGGDCFGSNSNHSGGASVPGLFAAINGAPDQEPRGARTDLRRIVHGSAFGKPGNDRRLLVDGLLLLSGWRDSYNYNFEK